MRRFIVLTLVVLLVRTAVSAEERQTLSLATAYSLFPEKITSTGRVQPQITARISPRVSGHLIEFGKDDAGRMLDVGMNVKAGQVLFQLNPTTFQNNLAAAEAALHSARANLANLTAKTREERLEALRQIIVELDARIADRQRDEVRYRRLVEQEKTMPVRRLEEVVTELLALKAQRAAATARLREAENGPTQTEIAVAEARVKEVEAALKAAQDDLRDTTVRAAFDGLITRRFKSPGDYIVNMPPTDVLELVAADKFEIELRLPEAYFSMIVPNTTPVLLRSPLLKQAMPLTITRVVADIDTAKGTFAVRIAIPSERRSGLISGAFVTADVALSSSGQSVIVPGRAVIQAGDQSTVFVADGGTMRQRSVELGDRLTEGVVVKSGLNAGQRVLVGPIEELKDGTPLPSYLQQTK